MDEVQKLLTEIEQEIIRGESIEGATAANVQRKRFKLLFRATSTKDLGTFHTICDGKGPTLTVLHGRYNVWFGGYTSKNWSKGKNNPVEDSHAFLFHKFDNTKDPCKLFPIKKKKIHRAIICDDNFGPTFGGKSGKDYDLQTFNLAGKNESVTKDDEYMLLNGSINFGMAYKGEGPLPKNEINGGTMEIKLIEIYSVVDGTPDNMWREKPSDDDVKEMKDEILTLIPLQGLHIQAYNILLVGVINSGKSSFCNTLLSEFADKIKFDVATGSEVNSVTNKVQQCRLSYKQQRTLCVNIIDIRGYDKQRSYEHELQHLLDGKLKKDYEFPDEAVEISEDELLKDPELNDQVHLVCFVVSGEKISAQEQDKNLISKLVQIKKTVRDRNIPIAAVVSKLDLKCPSIKYDADNVYTSPIAADTIKKVAEVLGMEVKDVFPIVNYVNDKELVPAKRRLVIKALHSMVHLAENCLEKYIQKDGRREALAIQILSDIRECKQKPIRILCVGEVNSGKTSFINSVRTALSGKPCTTQAGRRSRRFDGKESFTDTFQTFSMGDSNVEFGDMPGFQNTNGVSLADVQKIINGQVLVNCMNKSGVDNRGNFFRKEPTKKDRFHCVCIVMDISSFDTLSQETSKLFEELMDWLDEKGIVFVCILTKIDELNSKTGDQDVEVKIGQIVKKFKTEKRQVMAVQNYVGREHGCEDKDVRLLSALHQIVELWKENMNTE